MLSSTMRISDLLERLPGAVVTGPVEREFSALATDSRAVAANGLFVALPGRHVDGHTFVPSLSCAAVVVQQDVEVRDGVTVVRVESTRKALAALASAVCGDPSEELDVIAITGTNGKTTTAWMVESMARAAGVPVGVIGTTGHRLDGTVLATGLTTPEAPEWQGLLRRMVDGGAELVVAEVSSIALASHRVDHTRFSCGVFTNISRDHLDYHGGWSAYRDAKARLFRELLPETAPAIVNADEPEAVAVAPHRQRARRWTYGLRTGDVRLLDVTSDLDGSRGNIQSPWGVIPFDMPLCGRHNLSNALAATTVALVSGLGPEAVGEGLTGLPQVPGRLQPVPNGRGVRVFVDYAHTDAALREVLTNLKDLGASRIITVVGCGGDRDPGKRVLMARAASRGSALVVATSDNPRSEDPLAILDAMRPGLGDAHVVEPDRARAIALAIREAGPGDVVLIAGKGHETTQEIGGQVLPFDDREVARAALEALGGGAESP